MSMPLHLLPPPVLRHLSTGYWPLPTVSCPSSSRHQRLFTRPGGLAALRSLLPAPRSPIPTLVDQDYTYLDKALPGFIKARGIIKRHKDSVGMFEFNGDKFEFYRFVNRYRMAVCFKGVKLEGFSAETEKGYSALTRIFLTYSVFERYTALAGIWQPYKPFFRNVAPRELTALADIIKRNDPRRKLFDFLRQLLKEDLHKQSLDRFQAGETWQTIYYASALRHMYVHGHLTASPQGVPADNIAMICNEVSRSLLHWIKTDFDRRLALAAMV